MEDAEAECACNASPCLQWQAGWRVGDLNPPGQKLLTNTEVQLLWRECKV